MAAGLSMVDGVGFTVNDRHERRFFVFLALEKSTPAHRGTGQRRAGAIMNSMPGAHMGMMPSGGSPMMVPMMQGAHMGMMPSGGSPMMMPSGGSPMMAPMMPGISGLAVSPACGVEPSLAGGHARRPARRRKNVLLHAAP